VERAIRYVRDSFWAGRSFTTLAECNRQALAWRDQCAKAKWRISAAGRETTAALSSRPLAKNNPAGCLTPSIPSQPI
jgi:hypothetical protein